MMDATSFLGCALVGAGCGMSVAPVLNSLFAMLQLWGMYGWRFWAVWWAVAVAIVVAGVASIYAGGLLLGEC